jgi:hypothetical protein
MSCEKLCVSVDCRQPSKLCEEQHRVQKAVKRAIFRKEKRYEENMDTCMYAI